MPEALGDYVLEGRLEGASSPVYRALAPQGDPVRLQVHAPSVGAAGDAVRAFERLTRALTRWGRHPWPGLETPVATVLPDASGRFALATAWIEGRPILDALPEGGCERLEEAVSVALRVGESLAALHADEAVHGAVAAYNVWKTDEGPILLGFWWSQANLRDHPGPAAPEAIATGRYDALADQWAWGRLLRTLLGGVDAPGDLATILTRTNEREPSARYADMTEALAALRAFEVTLATDDVDPNQDPFDRAATEDLGSRTIETEAPTVDLGRADPAFEVEPPTVDVQDALEGAETEDRTAPHVPPRPSRSDPTDDTQQLGPARSGPRAGPWLIWTAAVGVFALAIALLLMPDAADAPETPKTARP